MVATIGNWPVEDENLVKQETKLVRVWEMNLFILLFQY